MKKPLFMIILAAAAAAGCHKKGGGGNGEGAAPPPRLKKSKTFFQNFRAKPKSLNPLSSYFAEALLSGYVFESLLARNIETYEWQARLAEKWEISPDGKTFAFSLYKGLKWSDGKPLTARDVKFSFEALKDPKYKSFHGLSYFSMIKSAKITGPRRIVFQAKEVHFNNFGRAAEMLIIPKHIYEKRPRKKAAGPERARPAEGGGGKAPKGEEASSGPLSGSLPPPPQPGGGQPNAEAVIGSGPYAVSNWARGKTLSLRRNPHYESRRDFPQNRGKWLFENIVFRFFPSELDIRLRLQNGELDYSWIRVESFEQSAPASFKKVKYEMGGKAHISYLGLNARNPLFRDPLVRQALAHLLNRELIRERFWFGHSRLAAGPWSSQSDFADPSVKPAAFNPKKAAALLKAAGWRDSDQNGVLEKSLSGQKKEFAFALTFPAKDIERYFTVYQEDLKKAGILMSLELKDPASYVKALQSGSFDVMIAGEAAIEWDPMLSWHSKNAGKDGLSNFIGYASARADALIEKGSRELDRKKRAKAFRKLYRLIAREAPVIFFLEYPFHFYGISKRIKTPKPYFKYDIGEEYWSF